MTTQRVLKQPTVIDGENFKHGSIPLVVDVKQKRASCSSSASSGRLSGVGQPTASISCVRNESTIDVPLGRIQY